MCRHAHRWAIYNHFPFGQHNDLKIFLKVQKTLFSDRKLETVGKPRKEIRICWSLKRRKKKKKNWHFKEFFLLPVRCKNQISNNEKMLFSFKFLLTQYFSPSLSLTQTLVQTHTLGHPANLSTHTLNHSLTHSLSLSLPLAHTLKNPAYLSPHSLFLSFIH